MPSGSIGGSRSCFVLTRKSTNEQKSESPSAKRRGFHVIQSNYVAPSRGANLEPATSAYQTSVSYALARNVGPLRV